MDLNSNNVLDCWFILFILIYDRIIDIIIIKVKTCGPVGPFKKPLNNRLKTTYPIV